MKKILVLIGIVAISIAFFFAGDFLIYQEDTSSIKDADIVLLMGSLPDRILGTYDLSITLDHPTIYIIESLMEGAELIEQKGVKIPNYADLAKDALIELGLDEHQIVVVDGAAESTIDEAVALKNFFAQKNYKKPLIVVTSKYHSRRAQWIFSEVIKDRQVLSVPTSYDRFEPQFWFTRREDSATVFMEYLKFLHFGLIEQHYH